MDYHYIYTIIVQNLYINVYRFAAQNKTKLQKTQRSL